MKKRLVSSILTLSMVAIAMAGCGDSNSGKTEATTAAVTGNRGPESNAAKEEPAGDAQVVTFWYNSTGDEAKIYEDVVAAYNASQSKYRAEGLSVTDGQKTIIAMSNNETPDVIKYGNQTAIQYTMNGLVEPLESYVKVEDFDLSIYSDQAVNANRVDGDLYAPPLNAYIIQIHYNRTLLKEARYTEPPKTMGEMYEMAVKATKADGNGNIDVLGYPLFPYASARQELIYGSGGRQWDKDSSLTPDNQGILDSLNTDVKFREEFGGKAFDSLIGTANTNRYTERDMFFQGRQPFRSDGFWLPTMMANSNSTVDYGIVLVPGTEAHLEYRGVSRFETDSIAVTSMSSSKDGIWNFTKWLCNAEGVKIINLGTDNLPATKFLHDDPRIPAIPGFAEFIDALKEEKGVQYPQMPDYDEYMNLVNPTLDTVYSGKMAPGDAMCLLKEQSAGLE